MVEGKILSVAPNCAHGYAVLLPNESILLSSTVVAAPISLVSKPPAGWEKKHPTHRVRGKSHLRWILAPAAALHRARWSPRGESASSALKGARSEGASAEGARSVASAEGARSEGARSVASAEGARSEGARSEGASVEGARSEGASAEGARSVGARSKGARSVASAKGARSEGARSVASAEGARSEGARAEGARSEGASAEGARSVGARYEGAKSVASVKVARSEGARSVASVEGARFEGARYEGARSIASAESARSVANEGSVSVQALKPPNRVESDLTPVVLAVRMLLQGNVCEADMCKLLQRIQESGESSVAEMRYGLTLSEGMMTLRKEPANRLPIVRCLNRFLSMHFPEGKWAECRVVPKENSGSEVSQAEGVVRVSVGAWWIEGRNCLGSNPQGDPRSAPFVSALVEAGFPVSLVKAKSLPTLVTEEEGPYLRMLQLPIPGRARLVPWPHPAREESHSLRYLLQCEPIRLMECLGIQGPEIGSLREVSPGLRLTTASAWCRSQPPEVWQRVQDQTDSQATSSSDGITPPETCNSSSSKGDFAEAIAETSLQEGRVRSERPLDEEEFLDPGEQDSISDLSVEEEYCRVHNFHHWDAEYRPSVVQQRVENWRRRGRRLHNPPDVEGLSGTENASVQMMVGYFLYDRPRATGSSTPSPPQIRVISVAPPNGESGSSLAYLRPRLPVSAPRVAAIEVDSGSEKEWEKVGYPTMAERNFENVESWEVELPVTTVTTEMLDDACMEHRATSLSVRRLMHDLEGLSSQDVLRQERLQLLQSQQEKKASLEEWLARAHQLNTISLPSQSAEAQCVSLTGEVPADTFLHTRTVSAAEVRKELDLWVEPACEELESLFDRTGACEKVDEQTVQRWIDEGQDVHILPGKAVCTRKAGIGKRRFRAVVCGNYMPQDTVGGETETFASGVECISVRCAVAYAARQGWSASSLDIRTAFLNAPARPGSGVKIVVKPPRLLTELALIPVTERWLVAKALYGLTTSPRDWSVYRNNVLRFLTAVIGESQVRLRQGAVDENVWQVVSHDGKILGLLIVYVDDLLCLAAVEVAEALWKSVQNQWQTTPPTWATKEEPISFCGVEVYQGDGLIWLRQTRYIQELLDRHQVEHEATLPMNAWVDPEPETSPSLSSVRNAQKVTGELLWLTKRSRPDLVFSVGKLSQWSTKAPQKVLEWSRQILKYLKGSKDLAIVYGSQLWSLGAHQQLQQPRRPDLLEIYADSSHAPQGFRSQQCVILLWQGDLIAWDAGRQPFTAMSSAEAELVGMLHAMTIAESIGPLFEEFQECDLRFCLLGDNAAACRSFEEAPCNWRSRHLRIRAAAGRERVQSQLGTVAHVPGLYQLADLATKPLPGSRLSWLLGLMNVISCPPASPVSLSAASPASGANPVGPEKMEKTKVSPGVEAKKGDTVSVRDDVPEASNPIGVACAKSSSLSTNPVQPSMTAALEEGTVEEVGSPRPTWSSDPSMGTTVRPQQVLVALLVIILASLSSPTMSSREIMLTDQASNLQDYVELQETAWFIFHLFLVVLVWEMVKYGCSRLFRKRTRDWCFGGCHRHKALLEVERFATSGPDCWEVYEKAGIAILRHYKPRKMLFDPEQAKLPFARSKLTGIRITLVYYTSEREFEFVLDRYSDSGRARYNLHRMWVGRTVLLLTQ